MNKKEKDSDVATESIVPDLTLTKEQLEAMESIKKTLAAARKYHCLLYTSPSPRDRTRSRMPSSA